LIDIRYGIQTKYRNTKANEMIIMELLTQTGINVCRVTNPSRNPAKIKKGTSEITILIPSAAPFRKAYPRGYEPGNRILLPNTIPAPPAIIIEVISRVP
jgi:hypothetical protein